jgi:hypothetical protein
MNNSFTLHKFLSKVTDDDIEKHKLSTTVVDDSLLSFSLNYSNSKILTNMFKTIKHHIYNNFITLTNRGFSLSNITI